MDISKLTKKEKIELLTKAKDAYYNTGEELLSDAEYDALEKELGFENKNYVGSKSGNYTVKHSFIMGSLAKVQIIQKGDSINWAEAADKINTFFHKAFNPTYLETTPKLDGCSFSLEFKNVGGKAVLMSAATRGDGQWGTDIRHWIEPVLKTKYWSEIDNAVKRLCHSASDILCIRGEVLVKQSVFSQKYSDTYVNPRAFTAGMIGLKYSDIDDMKKLQGGDLHFVCYDYRLVTEDDTIEMSWMNPHSNTYSMLEPYLGHIGELPDLDYCKVWPVRGRITPEFVEEIYDFYNDYRLNGTDYALDGVVMKPECEARQQDLGRERPIDCIAMKFMPMINATTVVDIDWNVKKTGEYFPTAILETVVMPDGKKVTKASLHNYNYIVKNEVGIGSKVRISLAGDIIPFVFEIVSHAATEDNINLPEDSYVIEDPKSGTLHLMKRFTGDEENRNKFVSSCDALSINSIGPAAAEALYDNLSNDIEGLMNVTQVMNDEAYDLIYRNMGRSRSVEIIVNNLKDYAKKITLVDVIRSFGFKLCGQRASEVCAKIISGASYSAASLPEVSYSWALDKSSRNYYLVMQAVDSLGIDIEESAEDADSGVKIPIIMTGSPEDCTRYATKQAWLKAHPQYVETTSWKECKILFTNDLNSKTGKMAKAAKAGVEIRQYDDNGVVSESVKRNAKRFNTDMRSDFLF